MFTGIIEQTAKVRSIQARGTGVRVSIEKPTGWKLSIGQSISINGDYMPETLLKTTVRTLGKGSLVNLERSLVYGARIEGHIVQGHVDATVEVASIALQGASRLVVFRIPVALKKCVALHGSITVNGVSLTVARLSAGVCTVALIPHTLVHTNLGLLAEGSRVNIEVDYLARYGIAASSASDTVLRNAAKGVQKGARRR